LIRHGLRRTLPRLIRFRLTKANFVEYGVLAAQQLYQATQPQLAQPTHPIWDIIDGKDFAKLVAIVFNPRFPVRQKTRYNWMVSRVIYLALWLETLPRAQTTLMARH
jgi:asparagine synthase (glutamine-hydrolysing)